MKLLVGKFCFVEILVQITVISNVFFHIYVYCFYVLYESCEKLNALFHVHIIL